MLIKRILIITNNGVPIFDYEKYSRGDEVLVSGLISAILRFVEETEKEKLSRVLLEESQFLIKSFESLIFVFQISDDMTEEYAEHIVQYVSSKFLEEYKNQYKSFSGNVSMFRGFQQECKKILQHCGLEIVNILNDSPEGAKLRAWCLFSDKNEILVVRANAVNYNIDSFPIFQVLGKSLRKVVQKFQNCSKGTCFHITHEGNIIQVITLPSVSIITESKLKELEVKRYRQYKTKTKEQIKEIFKSEFNPDQIEVYGKNIIAHSAEELSQTFRLLVDLFKAAEKGSDYLFNSSTHIQILTMNKKTLILIKLVNKWVFIEYKNEKPVEEILYSTKKVFEKEHKTKVDSPAVMLEK